MAGPPTAVLDTNVWVSAFLNPEGFPARLIAQWRAGRFAVITSPPRLAELARVLARPRLQRIRRFSAAEATLYVLLIQARARVVGTTGHLRICRDPTDDELLETALVGAAGYVVSRDADFTRDLVVIEEFAKRGVQIVTVQQFLQILARTK